MPGKISPPDEGYYRTLIEKVKMYGFHLKINTVVHHFNYREKLSPFIEEISPQRWKIFRVLPVDGQNDLWNLTVSIFQLRITNIF
ncbi:MAG: hypothetical protein R3B93_10755 [Bacteroidia bacterium]